jgi:hypothetical protein
VGAGRRNRRLLAAAGAMLLLAGLAAATALTLLARTPSGAAQAATCRPAPCAAPAGMELHVDQLTVSPHGERRRLLMTVHFVNHTQPQLAEATSSRHTGLADFRLEEEGGRTARPVYGDGCPQWPDVTLARGEASDEETVCFDLAGPPREGAKLEWSPDLGLLFRSVTVDLGSLPG